jgi:hypothetical protein
MKKSSSIMFKPEKLLLYDMILSEKIIMVVSYKFDRIKRFIEW